MSQHFLRSTVTLAEQENSPKVEAGKAPSNFTLFPKLPLELRLQIFSETENFVKPQPVHALATACRSEDPLTILCSCVWSAEPGFNPKFPVALSICSESRQETLRKYTPWDSTRTGERGGRGRKPIYVNLKTDIFMYGGAPWFPEDLLKDYGLTQDPATFEPSAFAVHTSKGISRYDATFGVICHLGIHFKTFYTADESTQAEFIDYLCHFSKLQTFTIFFNPAKHLGGDLSLSQHLEKPKKDSVIEKVAERFRHDMEIRLCEKANENPMFRIPKVEILINREHFEQMSRNHERRCCQAKFGNEYGNPKGNFSDYLESLDELGKAAELAEIEEMEAWHEYHFWQDVNQLGDLSSVLRSI